VSTFVQARELTNSREAMFVVKNKNVKDIKTMQVVYAEQFDATTAQFCMAVYTINKKNWYD